MCQVKPSDLESVYWSHSYEDLRTLVSLWQQHELAKAQQQFENLVIVASKALGGGTKEEAKPVETMSEAIAQFKKIGGTVQ